MTQTIICENCGFEAPSIAMYCPSCGKNLKLQKQEWVEPKIAAVRQPYHSDLNLNQNSINNFISITKELQNLDKSEEAYNQHYFYVSNLSRDVAQAKQNYQYLQQLTQKEYRDVEALKSLSWASLRAAFQGNKDQQIQKEQREYLEALSREQAAKRDFEEINRRLMIAQSEISPLEKLMQRKQTLEEELRKIVDKACEGVPDQVEDQLEVDYAELIAKKNPIAQNRVNLKNALGHISNALNHFRTAQNSLRQAKGASDWDTFLGGGFFVDMMKHSEVADARDQVQMGYRSLQMAYQIIPHMPQVQKIDVHQSNFFFDTMFDNIFSDLHAREQIMQSRERVNQATNQAERAKQWIHGELDGLEGEYGQLESQILELRKKLTKERIRMIREAIA